MNYAVTITVKDAMGSIKKEFPEWYVKMWDSIGVEISQDVNDPILKNLIETVTDICQEKNDCIFSLDDLVGRVEEQRMVSKKRINYLLDMFINQHPDKIKVVRFRSDSRRKMFMFKHIEKMMVKAKDGTD